MSLTGTSTTYLVLFTFFAVLPFAQRLRIGKFIEFEKAVREFEKEVKEVRTETGELTTSVSVVADAISPIMNQPVTTNAEEAQAVPGELSKGLPLLELPKARQNLQEYLEASDSSVTHALGRLRMDLERELRRILGAPAVVADSPSNKRGRAAILTAQLLFRRLGFKNSRYRNLQNVFDYVWENCNGAINTQHIPEALLMK